MTPDSNCEDWKWERQSLEVLLWNTDTTLGSEECRYEKYPKNNPRHTPIEFSVIIFISSD